MSEPLVFDDLEPRSEAFKMGGEQYVLREPTEKAAVRYRNAIAKATRFGPDGKPSGMGDIASADPVLLSDCLFRVTDKGEQQVSTDEILTWTARKVKPLMARLKEMGELDDRETPESIDEKIARLQEQRAALAGEGEGTPEKNGRVGMTPTSASRTN
jgi:hypothetical protein